VFIDENQISRLETQRAAKGQWAAPPELDSFEHRIVGAAPGTYVLEK